LTQYGKRLPVIFAIHLRYQSLLYKLRQAGFFGEQGEYVRDLQLSNGFILPTIFHGKVCGVYNLTMIR